MRGFCGTETNAACCFPQIHTKCHDTECDERGLNGRANTHLGSNSNGAAPRWPFVPALRMDTRSLHMRVERDQKSQVSFGLSPPITASACGMLDYMCITFTRVCSIFSRTDNTERCMCSVALHKPWSYVAPCTNQGTNSSLRDDFGSELTCSPM